MSEFKFLGTWNDSWGIVAAILGNGDYTLVPDLLYDKPEPVFLTGIDDTAKRLVRVKSNGFLWSRKFSVFPPVMKRIKGGVGDGKYYVTLLEGGPYLRLILPPCYEESGVINLSDGSLHYPDWTTKAGTNEVLEPSPELKMAFKEAKAIIKKQLVRLKARPDIWSGREASSLVEANRAVIHGFQPPGEKSAQPG